MGQGFRGLAQARKVLPYRPFKACSLSGGLVRSVAQQHDSRMIMAKHKDLISAIGNTPLIRLNRVSALTGCDIWGKAEFLNPGQSVKDRAALFIIHDLVKSGALKPGGTIVEGTAGNTGIGLTLVANSLGFKSEIVIPETQSQEKKDALRLYGAELIEVPAKPYKHPNNYIKL